MLTGGSDSTAIKVKLETMCLIIILSTLLSRRQPSLNRNGYLAQRIIQTDIRNIEIKVLKVKYLKSRDIATEGVVF